MKREVIVVGAGPGGASTAITLAQQGRDVLLIDRNNFPRDKSCGDAIPSGVVDQLIDMGLKEKFDAANFYRATAMLITAGERETLVAPLNIGKKYQSDSYIVPRVEFDFLLQQHAVEVGAEFCQGRVTAPLLENGVVVGVEVMQGKQTHAIYADVVVGADGVTSVITRALRPQKNKHVEGHRAIALRAYIDDIEVVPQQVEFYLYKEILPGYAWIFPNGEEKANIGLGMRLDRYRKQGKKLEEMLDDFMEMPIVKARLKRGGEVRDISTWQLNFGSQKDLQHAYNGALLVGDAAGLINPLTGGGIDNAIISGVFAAQVIDDALKRGDVSREGLKIYEQMIADELWDGMRRSYYFQLMLNYTPFIIRWLLRHMSNNNSFTQTFLSKL